jgi:hypothetical protein
MRERRPYGFNTDDLQTRICIGEAVASIILAADMQNRNAWTLTVV